MPYYRVAFLEHELISCTEVGEQIPKESTKKHKVGKLTFVSVEAENEEEAELLARMIAGVK
jgi:hypothetical protein